MPIGDGDDRSLHGGEPQWQVARRVLDEDAEEALDGAEERTVQHPRTLGAVLRRAVDDVEALGQVEVHLHGRALPPAADGIFDLDVDFRPVKGAVAFVNFVGDAAPLDGLAQEALGLLPHVVGADGLLRARRYLGRILEAELAHDVVGQIEDGAHLVDHLVFTTKHMRVVLGESARAHQAMHRAGQLVAIHRAELEVAYGHLAVAVDVVFVQDNVPGAVHGLDPVLGGGRVVLGALVDVEEIHVVAVVAVVTRGLPHVGLVNVRGDDLLVAAAVQLAAQPLLQQADDARTGRQIQRQADAGPIVHHVDAQLAAELAVIALLGFLQAREVGLQVFLGKPGGAVDALEHLALAVAAPVGARHLHQLEGLGIYHARARDVRPGAQVHKVAVAIDGDGGVVVEVVDVLELEALVAEHLLGLRARDDLAHKRLVFGDDLAHLDLDGLEVVLVHGTRQLEIVEETVVGLRAEGNLRARKEALHGLGHDMRAAMAHDA